MSKRALIIIDVQNDFINGTLKVNNAINIIPGINSIRDKGWDVIIITKDWHPINHISFASTHKRNIFTKVKFKYIQENILITQMLWPNHCVQNLIGSQIHDDLIINDNDHIVQKGTNPLIDSYSAFWDAIKKNQTNLLSILQQNNINNVYLTGLALDVCVAHTAVDSLDNGFTTYIIKDLTKAVDDDNISEILTTCKTKGVKYINSKDIIKKNLIL
jgi:nicotinamidase/pyrazinamidase